MVAPDRVLVAPSPEFHAGEKIKATQRVCVLFLPVVQHVHAVFGDNRAGVSLAEIGAPQDFRSGIIPTFGQGLCVANKIVTLLAPETGPCRRERCGWWICVEQREVLSNAGLVRFDDTVFRTVTLLRRIANGPRRTIVKIEPETNTGGDDDERLQNDGNKHHRRPPFVSGRIR